MLTRAAGVRLGDYELIAPLGRGGMGEVWRARDHVLGRDVALKFLTEDVVLDPDRVRRFEREAQVLAAINDPRIGAIYGITPAPDRALVLEFIDGETLASRVARGPLSPDVARALGVQLAEALTVAHEHGIVHRDLKPANIKITSRGAIKVLDFGIAKILQPADAGAVSTLSISALTRAGSTAGTPAYMSPEQTRGEEIDERTDVWAFGCVLYEMLTGASPFRGATTSDTIAAVLERSPDYSRLPSSTPLPLRRTIERCLRKDPSRRLRAIADARLELEDEQASPPPALSGRRPARMMTVAIAAALVGAAVTALVFMKRGDVIVQPSMRFDLTLPDGDEILIGGSIALSRDERLFAFAGTHGGVRGIFIHPLNSDTVTLLAGTENGTTPFFSPDGAWVGFFAEGKLKKVPARGGAAVVICEAPIPRGAAWADNNTIVFAPTFFGGVFAVSAEGGTPRAISTPNASVAVASHRWPAVLPRSLGVLYAEGPVIATPRTWNAANVVAQRLDGSERRVVITGGTAPQYLPGGHLLFMRGSTVYAVPFDAERLQVRGTPVPVLEDVRRSGGGGGDVVAGGSGLLVAVTGSVPQRRDFVWVTRDGAEQPLRLPPAPYFYPRLSPDGEHLAFTLEDDVWTYDIGSDTRTRLTFEGINFWPVWSHDGKRIAFASNRVIPTTVFVKSADGGGTEAMVAKTQQMYNTGDWSPDGSTIALNTFDPRTGTDVSTLSVDDGRTQAFASSPAIESSPAFSPDGRWVAYTSNMSGRPEVFVSPFPARAVRWQVSTDGGGEPLWGASGRTLYFRNGDALLQVTYSVDGQAFRAGKPALVFRKRYASWANITFTTSYGIAPDERRFLMARDLDATPRPRVRVLVNAVTDAR